MGIINRTQAVSAALTKKLPFLTLGGRSNMLYLLSEEEAKDYACEIMKRYWIPSSDYEKVADEMWELAPASVKAAKYNKWQNVPIVYHKFFYGPGKKYIQNIKGRDQREYVKHIGEFYMKAFESGACKDYADKSDIRDFTNFVLSYYPAEIGELLNDETLNNCFTSFLTSKASEKIVDSMDATVKHDLVLGLVMTGVATCPIENASYKQLENYIKDQLFEGKDSGEANAQNVIKQQAVSILQQNNINEEDYEKTADTIFSMVPQSARGKVLDKWTAVVSYGSIYFGK